MKTSTTTITERGLRSRQPLARMIGLSILATGWLAHAQAENVDSELVLLVDITQASFNNTEFNQLMEGYATAFTSTQIMDSIQSGAYGRIAVSIMFFGNSATVGVPWMTIGNFTQAQQFADLVRNVNRPSLGNTSDAATGVTAATLSFGSETGGTANGFESVIQIIEVAAGRAPQNGTAGATVASSANALASGVDLINALALGNRANTVDTFYSANVIGSTIGGVAPSSNTSPIDGTLAATMRGLISGTVQTGATVSTNAVPEPSTLFSLIPATLLILRRRRQH